MKRILNLFVSLIAIVFLFLPIVIVAMLVALTSKGPVLHWSDRVGQEQ